MKSYSSIEELSKDLQISERTGWRWLEKGTVQKVQGEDGRTAFTLSAYMTDDRHDVSTDMGRNKKPLPVKTEPSIQEGTRLREPSDPRVKEMSKEADIKKLNVEVLEADAKVEELLEKKRIQQREQHSRKIVEAVKAEVIPVGLRKEMPPDLLFTSLRLIEESLKGVDLYSFDEVEAFAASVIRNYWTTPAINRLIRSAIARWIFVSLDLYLHAAFETCREKGYEGSYNNFMAYIFLGMAPEKQMEMVNFAYYGK